MNIQWDKKKLEIGIIEPEYIDFLKHEFLNDILESKEQKSVNALVAYAGFLNSIKINPDNYPLFIDILSTNNAAAIDVLLEGYTPENLLDVVVPNHFIVKTFFDFLNNHKKNEIYEKTLEVIIGFLSKVYRSVEEGYQLYQPTITDVNALGKFLDETKDQEDPLNRSILDVLYYFSQLDKAHETEQNKLDISRQSSNIRSDFFDNSRSLLNSLTEVTLQMAENVSFGPPPEYFYGKKPG
ncbi:MAG TPA: hypothetical protein PLG79_05230 [Spirochaetales bacterium]|nr:hypothetical protein [Spirochaetales bacterium]